MYSGNLLKVYLFQFLVSMHFIAGVLVPFFTDWGGISFAQTMLLQAWFVGWIFLLEVPTGAVADRYGRKTSLALGGLFVAAAVVVYVSRPSFGTFLVGEFLWAMAAALISGADEALVYDTLKALGREHRSKTALARLASCHTGAIMVSAPLGSLMGARFGLQVPVAAMAVPAALACLLALTIDEPPSERPSGESYLGTLRSGVSYFLRHKILLGLAFDSVTIGTLSFMGVWLSQPYLLSLGLPMAWLGFVFSAMTGSQILVANRFDVLERLTGGKRRYLLTSSLIPVLCYLLLPLTRRPLPAAGLFVILCAFGLSRSVLIGNYMNKHIDSANRATVLSSVGMLRKLFAAVLYPTVGLLSKWSVPGALAALGAVMLVCALASRVQEAHLTDSATH